MPARLQAAAAATNHLSPVQLQHLLQQLIEEQDLQLTRQRELEVGDDLEPDLVEVLLTRCREALADIEEALSLLYRDAYGACSACSAPIPFERLEAVPGTQRCVSCQAGRPGVLR